MTLIIIILFTYIKKGVKYEKIKLLTSVFSLSLCATTLPVIACCTPSNTKKTQSSNLITANSKYVTVTFKKGEAESISGSTVFKVKKSRKFGTIVPPVVTKTDFEFDYWQDQNNQKYDSTTLVSYDAILTPVFKQASVTLSFNTLGGAKLDPIKNIDSTKSLSEQGISLPTPTKSETEFEKWLDSNGNEVNNDSIISSSQMITAKWKEDLPSGYIKIIYQVSDSTKGSISGPSSLLVPKTQPSGSTTTFKDLFKPTIVCENGCHFVNYIDESGVEITDDTELTQSQIITAKLTFTDIEVDYYFHCNVTEEISKPETVNPENDYYFEVKYYDSRYHCSEGVSINNQSWSWGSFPEDWTYTKEVLEESSKYYHISLLIPKKYILPGCSMTVELGWDGPC